MEGHYEAYLPLLTPVNEQDLTRQFVKRFISSYLCMDNQDTSQEVIVSNCNFYTRDFYQFTYRVVLISVLNNNMQVNNLPPCLSTVKISRYSLP